MYIKIPMWWILHEINFFVSERTNNEATGVKFWVYSIFTCYEVWGYINLCEV